ncbi:L,D-transpeptidase [Shinella fusca]|jgi:lipoprotein-anchoring transpeptidase ErfK/SrfK|uniref:Lipoprotein-anchoring transpeptidase ErfK/SrfK n=1 Tax=Shinella fusca TaxID=544480 RepID=A0A7W7YWK6_9HYPH|nr:L,D-transpeptidase [Shinella fusca]MBB5043674.1 lipoprotein-anchoring transpeptidase ErfK/SrfK [Shinella fusca]
MPAFRSRLSPGRLAILSALPALLLAFPAPAEQTVRQFDARAGKWVVRRIDNARLAGRLNAAPIAARNVAYAGEFKAGTVIVDTQKRRLFYVNGNGTAREYVIGVGREGFAWKGRERISRKAEWPVWTPPAEMVSREAAKGRILPASMEGGPENPLGARAIYLGDTLYRIHGTNEPWTLGKAVSSGCIRMANDDVVELFDKVDVGSLVVVR